MTHEHSGPLIGFRVAEAKSWMEIAHPKMRGKLWVYRCEADGEIFTRKKDGEELPIPFDPIRRSRQASEHPRKASRTVIDT